MLLKIKLLGNLYLQVMKKINQIFSYLDFEALFWICALLLLAVSDPYSKVHYTLFLPSILFDIPSPGYGLGHSISHFFHGNILLSFKTHPLGIITIIVLLGRSVSLLRKSYYNSIKKGQL